MFTETNGKIDIFGSELSIDCITSNHDKFHLDQNGNLTVNSITTVDNSKNSKIDLPIGSIYENRLNIKVEDYFIGTWVRYGNGKVLVGVDETDEIFQNSDIDIGEKEHILTIDEIPSHNHNTYNEDFCFTTLNPISKRSGRFQIPKEGTGAFYTFGSTSNYEDLSLNKKTGSIGKSNSHNNIQPSKTIYRWVRIY